MIVLVVCVRGCVGVIEVEVICEAERAKKEHRSMATTGTLWRATETRSTGTKESWMERLVSFKDER